MKIKVTKISDPVKTIFYVECPGCKHNFETIVARGVIKQERYCQYCGCTFEWEIIEE